MDVQLSVCHTVQAAFELLGKKWTGLVVHILMDGQKHFCELKRAVPDLSDRMLSLRMRELEDAGLIEREVQTGTPVGVVYRLTAKGLALKPALEHIAHWAHDWQKL